MAVDENNETEVNAVPAQPSEAKLAVNNEAEVSAVATKQPEADAESLDKGQIPETATVKPLEQDRRPPREANYSNAQLEQLKNDTKTVNITLMEIESQLTKQLEKMYAANRTRLYLSSAMMIFISWLLAWTWLNLHTAFRPENLANATANIVIEAIPNATDHLHILLIDGAPDIAETFGEYLTESIPVFREQLSQEFQVAVEELSSTLAAQAVETVLNLPPTDEAETRLSTLLRLDSALEEMYNSPLENGSEAVREDLQRRMSSMTVTNNLLKDLSIQNIPVAQEELLIGWLHIVSLAAE
jgi:hypothetical protein